MSCFRLRNGRLTRSRERRSGSSARSTSAQPSQICGGQHELVVTLAERDLRVRYKQAFLGFAWAVFAPVTLMLVFTFVFTKFAKIQTAPGVPYALFSYLGLLPWTFFSNSVSNGGSLVTNMAS